MKNKKYIVKIIEILLITSLSVFLLHILNPAYNKGLIDDIYKKTDSVEHRLIQINDSLQNLNTHLFKLQNELRMNSLKTEENIHKIILKQKQLEHEQDENHQSIINDSDSADWEWFNTCFPK